MASAAPTSGTCCGLTHPAHGPCSPHPPTQDGNTPLHKAAYKGHAHVVRLLLDAGADRNAANKVRRAWALEGARSPPSPIAPQPGARLAPPLAPFRCCGGEAPAAAWLPPTLVLCVVPTCQRQAHHWATRLLTMRMNAVAPGQQAGTAAHSIMITYTHVCGAVRRLCMAGCVPGWEVGDCVGVWGGGEAPQEAAGRACVRSHGTASPPSATTTRGHCLKAQEQAVKAWWAERRRSQKAGLTGLFANGAYLSHQVEVLPMLTVLTVYYDALSHCQ
jgi:hypothetical protein